MIFSKELAGQILAGKVTATLQLPSANLKPESVRRLRRRVMRHDADGVELGYATETVMSGHLEEREPMMLTILQTDIRILENLSQQEAQWCGYRTHAGLVDAWLAEHPNTMVVLFVRFALGDVRDRARLMRRVGGDTMIRSMSIDPDAPMVPADFQKRLSAEGRERDRLRLAGDSWKQTARSLAIRLKEAEKRGDRDAIPLLRAELERLDDEMRAA